MANRAALIRAENEGLDVARKGRRFLEFALPDGKTRHVATIDPLHIRTTGAEIDTAWEDSDQQPYFKQMVKSDYHVYAGLNSGVTFNAGQIIEYRQPDTGAWVKLQPQDLVWENEWGSTQYISAPQGVAAQINDDTLYWSGAYGSGRNFQWRAETRRLRKDLILDSLAQLGSPPAWMTPDLVQLRLQFLFEKSENTQIWYDDGSGYQLWDESTTVQTNVRVEFRQGDTRLWWFEPGYAYDASQDNQLLLTTRLLRSGNVLFVEIVIPWTWLLAAAYPVVVDPTFTDGYGGDETTYQDVWLNPAQGTHNNGAFERLLSGTTNANGLIEFDLSDISAGSTCDSATIYVYQIGTAPSVNGLHIDVYSVASANAAWIEGTHSNATAGAGEPCWNALAADGSGGVTTAWAGSAGCNTSGTDYEASVLGTLSIGNGDTAGTEYSATLTTSRIDDWFGGGTLNYGLLLKMDAGGSGVGRIGSSDHSTTGYRPKLVVAYTAGGSASPSATPSASPSQGTPSGSPSEGTPSGSPSEGTESASPSEGTPSASPSEGTPSGSPSEGTESASPSEGTPSASPSEGTPSGSPSEGTESASPSEATPSGSPSEGTGSASPSEATPSGSPSEGTESGSPSEGTESGSPSEGTESASPSEATPSVSPSEGTESASPSEGTESASPSEGTESASPSEGTPSGSPSEGTASASPSEGTPSGSPSEGTESGSPSEGTPSGSPSEGTPSGSPSEGTESASPSEGTGSASPSEGTESASPSEGTPSGSPSEGTASGSPSEGTESASPSEGTPSASPSEGTESASPSEGTPSGSPSEGTESGSPSEGTESASPSEGTGSASPSEGTPSASPSEGTESASPSEGTPSGSPSEGTESASPSEGTPSASPSEGTASGSPSEGTGSASPSEGTASASPSEGTESASPSEGTPSGSPSEGTPSASPSEGTPSGSPSEGTPSGSPSEGTPSGSPSGSPSEGTPSGSPSASPSEGTPSASPETDTGRWFIVTAETRRPAVAAETRRFDVTGERLGSQMEQILKDPQAILDYGFDWEEWLSTDTIATSSWATSDGLTEVSDSHTATTTTVWLSSGTPGQDYTAVNTITTAAGRTDERTIMVLVRQR